MSPSDELVLDLHSLYLDTGTSQTTHVDVTMLEKADF